jgi:hypothetical protein
MIRGSLSPAPDESVTPALKRDALAEICPTSAFVLLRQQTSVNFFSGLDRYLFLI